MWLITYTNLSNMGRISKTLDIRTLGPCKVKTKMNKGWRVKDMHGNIIVMHPYLTTTYSPIKKKKK